MCSSQVHLHRYLLNTFIYAAAGRSERSLTALLAAYPTARLDFRFDSLVHGARSASRLRSRSSASIVPGVLHHAPTRPVRHAGSGSSSSTRRCSSRSPSSSCGRFSPALPYEIEEAAIMDGAGYFTILRRIIVPLARPALVTVGGARRSSSSGTSSSSPNCFTVTLRQLQHPARRWPSFESLFERNNTGAARGRDASRCSCRSARS